MDGLYALPARLEELGARNVLLITTPARRFVDRLALDRFDVHLFDGARVHVPRAVVDAALSAFDEAGADTVVTLGGGSATGLGKALRLEREAHFVVIPTTYSGSEMTNLHGITDGREKATGRDDRVRPDLVVHEPSLFDAMPKRLTIASLLNALAHPIGALSAQAVDDALRLEALRAVELLSRAVDTLLEAPTSVDGRRAALAGAARAGSIVDQARLGVHHRVAHALGGRFGLDHSGLHAVLLPHTVRELAREDRALHDAIAERSGHSDLPAALYDALTRAGAARSLTDLGVEHEPFETAVSELEVLRAEWIDDARLGHRPSIHQRREAASGRPATAIRGPELRAARRVVLAVHGRGANAGRMIRDVLDLTGHDPTIAIVAPQAPRGAWYPKSHRASLEEHGEELDLSLLAVRSVLERLLREVPAEAIFLAGFSQGACLAAELFARTEPRLGGLVAIAGARIGPVEEQPAIVADLAGARVLLGANLADPWIMAEDVHASAAAFRAAGADVELAMSPGEAHELSVRQRALAQELLTGRPIRAGQSGFGNNHESEALPDALPRHQNSPSKTPYGLYAEQINGTGFVAPRHENLRSWLYRIRPSAQHTPFAHVEHPTLVSDWDSTRTDPNLVGHRPLPAPTEPTDFVDGLATYGGAGHPRLRRGYAIHVYAANRSMEHRAFYDADGDLVIIPQLGALTFRTELGLLEAGPGQIVVIPRGLKFSVHLHDELARGWIGEVYGRHFELPERGVVGANGTVDARHFRAPTASFEDRIDPGYRIAAKLHNELFEATQDFTPWDVAAWHGNYAPYVYDLADFSPVGNTRIDHGDPSMHLVLGAPLDEMGADSLDLVFFPPRWDPTEHTFRPPFFHRNAIMEFNGVISDSSVDPDSPFQPGGYFLTPSMTAHGVLARVVESTLRRDDEGPVRVADDSRWFQFESALPIGLTSWARQTPTRREEWPHVWGAYRSHFSTEK